MQRRFALIGIVACALAVAAARAQGPLLVYLAHPSTELSWASCRVFLEGGSSQRIPFLPIVTRHRAPAGTHAFTRDIRVSAPVVFVGNGIVSAGRFTAYGDLDVAGKVVLFAYDFPDETNAALEKEFGLYERVREAASRKAAAVVVFSEKEETPFPRLRVPIDADEPEVPAIAVNRRSAEMILAAAGIDAATMFAKWKAEGTFTPAALIARLGLRIDGAFPRIARPNFTFRFEPTIPAAQRTALAAVNDKAVAFAVQLFKAAQVEWRKSSVTYFRDFDSKVFYTHHWGRGLSSSAGNFLVIDPTTIDYGLAVHENTHTLLSDSWGGTSSFMTEGFARYAESAAIDPDRDHRETTANVKAGTLPAVEDMLPMTIGSDPKTAIAYPASGSFVTFLIARHGLGATKRAYQLEARDRDAKAQENTWTQAFGRSLADLDSAWRQWLADRK